MKYAIFLLFSCFSFATTLENDPKVLHGKLDNGMTYYIYKTSLKEAILKVNMVVKTGSLYENEDEKGLAHYTEHMVFRGTKNFKDENDKEFQSRFGGKSQYYSNAFTSFNTTEYTLTHYAPDNRIVDGFLFWMHEMMFEAKFDADLLDMERNIVLSEGAMKDSRNEHFKKARFRFLGLDGIANNFPIGLKSVVENTTSEKMHAFYKREYRPDKMALIIYSNIDAHTILSKIESIFTTTVTGQATDLDALEIKSEEIPKALFYYNESCGSNNVIFERVTKPDYSQHYDQESLKVRFFSKSFYSVINAIISQKAVKSANYKGAELFSYDYTDELSRELIYVELLKGEEKDGLKSFYSDLYSTLAYLKSEKGVNELLSQAYGDRCIDDESPDYLISSIIETLRDSYIFNIGYPGRETLHHARLKAQSCLTKDDIINHVKNFEANLSKYMHATIYSTQESPLVEQDLADIIQDPIIEEADESDESFKLIIQDSWFSHGYLHQVNDGAAYWYQSINGTYYFECSNGLLVAVIPDQGAKYTMCKLVASGGRNVVNKDELASYSLIGDTINNSGLSNLDNEGTRVYLSEKALRLHLFCMPTYRGVQIQSFNTGNSYEDLKDMFHLLNACFEQHKFKKEIFDYFIKGTLEEHSNSVNDEGVQFDDWLQRTLYGNNPYYTAADPIEANFESAQRLCTKLFGNPRDFCLHIWTNASYLTIDSLIYKYLSPIMNKGSSLKNECPETIEFASGEHTFYHTYEQGSWGYVYMPLLVTNDSIEKILARSILSHIIQNRLHESLRVKQGLSYTQSSHFFCPAYNTDYSILRVSFTSQDEHIAIMHECVKNIFIDIFANGITIGELNEARATYSIGDKCSILDMENLISELMSSSPLYISNVLQGNGDAA